MPLGRRNISAWLYLQPTTPVLLHSQPYKNGLTYGTNGQVKITTKFLIKNDSPAVDSVIQTILYDGLKGLYGNNITMDQFSSEDETVGILSTQKVGATIASDVTRKSIWAIIVALVLMFIYIAIRFKKWQYGVASIMALTR